MATPVRIRTLNFLPDVFKTPTNAEFLNATLDQLVNPPNNMRVQGYIGKRLGYNIDSLDKYIPESDKTRTDYQLEPGIVMTNTNENAAKDFITYPGILDTLKLNGSITDDHSRLFTSQTYSWDSFINLDKFINYHQYYWLPEGPDSVAVSNTTVYIAADYVVQDSATVYNIYPVAGTPGSPNATLTLMRGGTYTFNVDQNSSFWIQGEPGLTGYSSSIDNLQTRDILGVSNNGTSSGQIIFTVPEEDAQSEYDLPGDNTIDLISTKLFSEVNGARLVDLGSLDSVTELNGRRVIFYNTGDDFEVANLSNFFGSTNYDVNDPDLTDLEYITVTQTASTGTLTCNSTANLELNQTITFSGNEFGGIVPGLVYVVSNIIDAIRFEVALSINGDTVLFNDETGSVDAYINLGLYEQSTSVNVNEYSFVITYLNVDGDPVLKLVPYELLPVNEKITAQYGSSWIGRDFYKTTAGPINLIPYLSAKLTTLYYQDGTIESKVGQIKLISGNTSNSLNVETDIIGKSTYTSPNDVVFTNGLKVRFAGSVTPVHYLNNEYYVEGVGTSIKLIEVDSLIAPEPYTETVYIPWDTAGFDKGNYEGNSFVPVNHDYITSSRASMDRNAWTRSNRWFHIDVINATALYNNTPSLMTTYTSLDKKAKRPIIEFYPNLTMFEVGIEGKLPVDFIDEYTTDALTDVAGSLGHYPDISIRALNATFTSTDYTAARTITNTYSGTNRVTISTTGMRVNDLIITDYNVGGLESGIDYYVKEIIDANTLTLSLVAGGEEVELTTSSFSFLVTWYPLSTIITLANTDIVAGRIIELDYIADRDGIIPFNSLIQEVTTDDTTTTLLVSWTKSVVTYQPTIVLDEIVCDSEGLSSYNIYNDARIVFINDINPDVRNKIYKVRYSDIDNTGTLTITLTEAEDTLLSANSSIVATKGYHNVGKTYFYDGDEWYIGQQKIKVNQPPNFDIFDNNNISLSDKSVYVGSSFMGTKLFSYKTGSGTNDPVLGMPLSYRALVNTGDIEYDINLNLDTFSYVDNLTPITSNINIGYVHQNTSINTYDRLIGWVPTNRPSVQYQSFEFIVYLDSLTTSFTCDIAAIEDQDSMWPSVYIYKDGTLVPRNQYSYTTSNSTTTVELLDVKFEKDSFIEIVILSNQVSKIGHYIPPINLTNNPLNSDITKLDFSDIRKQYASIIANNTIFNGEPYGANSYRDAGPVVSYGTQLIKNSGSLAIAGALLRGTTHNFFDAIAFNSREYVKFKNLLIDAINKTDFVQMFDPSEILDQTLEILSGEKSINQTFFWSDMLPAKSAYVSNQYTFNNGMDVSRYPLLKTYDFTKASYDGVLVYLKRNIDSTLRTIQLIKDIDYIVDTESPTLIITKDLLEGDIIVVNEYNQTYGSYVPSTPTKLGMYPAYIPKVVYDDSYNNPTYFIKGHDGSYTKLFGSYDPITEKLVDFRDQALLEFETRIFNNLKLDHAVILDNYSIIPGNFRNNLYSNEEFLRIYQSLFLNWVGESRVDYKNQYFSLYDEFTYNYTGNRDKLSDSVITQGNWRGIYKHYYDTTSPHTTPWEMIGYKEKPTWWDSKYGEAPYTSENLILWTDLENGLDWNNGNPIVREQFKRPDLYKILPVDEHGDLKSPLQCIVNGYNNNTVQREWKVGDLGPVEYSYRMSSTYPYDLMKMYALMKPAEFFNLGVDIDNFRYNSEFDQVISADRKHLQLDKIELYGNGIPKTSYLNWIIDYDKRVGIDATSEMNNLLNNIDVRLIYRLSGFTDKSLLKMYIEKGSVNTSSSSLLIPDENFQLMLYDNQPIDTIIYSPVIIQVTDYGFSIYGNSQNKNYFEVLQPNLDGNNLNIKIENITVKVAKNYSSDIIYVPYGARFYSVEEVAQFLMNYGKNLESKGMIFNNSENTVTIDWSQMVAEFLYWAQTGWDTGSVLSLNPSANGIEINKDSHIVQPLTLQRTNFILNQNLFPIENSQLKIIRNGTFFNASPLNIGDAISYSQFNIINFEHGIVLDNTTMFNDVIYNPTVGIRQERLVLKGSKTAEWDGTVTASGFIYNQDNIKDWVSNRKYTKGEIVRYKNKYWIANEVINPVTRFDINSWRETDYGAIQKGLLPNPNTRSYESTLYYDTNIANLEQDADLLAYSLIGYRPRDYMSYADISDTSQVNAYKSIIKEKGTLKSANMMQGITLSQGTIDYTIYENWAIKSKDFGGILDTNFIEFKLNIDKLTGNPSLIEITNGISEYNVNDSIPIYNIFNYQRPVFDKNIFSVTNEYNNTLIPYAGYVNFNDIKMSSYYYEGMDSAINSNGEVIPISDFYVRDYVWLADHLGTWQIYTPSSLGTIDRVNNNLNGTATVHFTSRHGLSQYEIVSFVNFSDSVDGYYSAKLIVDEYNIIVDLDLGTLSQPILGLGVAMRYQSQRVSKPSNINTLPLVDTESVKNTVWVDEGTSGTWEVYRKSLNYKFETDFEKVGGASTEFGKSVCVIGQNAYLIASTNSSNIGEVTYYTKDEFNGVFTIKQTLTGTTSSFGTIVKKIGRFIIVTEPALSPYNYVHIYAHNTNEYDNTITYLQTFTSTDDYFGTGVTLSEDEKWLYITGVNAGKGLVYISKQKYILTPSNNLTTNDIYEIVELGDTDWTSVGANPGIVGEIFKATGSVSGTGYARNISYASVSTSYGLVSNYNDAADQFGLDSITTNYDGTVVAVGSPGSDYDVDTVNWGRVQIFQRIKQNIEVQNSSTNNYQSFSLGFSFSTTSYSVNPASNTAGGQWINLSSTSGLAVDDPIVFTGTIVPGSYVRANKIYYVDKVSTSPARISIKQNKWDTDYITLGSFSGSSNVYIYDQSTVHDRILVELNGIIIDDSKFSILSSQLNYYDQLNAGDIITINHSYGVYSETLTTGTDPHTGVLFGNSIDFNRFGTELVVGAPYELSFKDNGVVNEGAAFRFTSENLKFGQFKGTSTCNLTTDRTVYINGYMITLPAGNATTVASIINTSGITNIYAESVDGILILGLRDVNLGNAGSKLTLMSPDNSLNYIILQELGFVHYTNTQVIEPPRYKAETQFGHKVKFNEFNSIVITAPAASRINQTTFDFTDDEKYLNDTLFDNNATQFIDEYQNVGSAYMFDYIANYNESLINLGSFVYAQALNSEISDFTYYPYYGRSMDFSYNQVLIGTPNYDNGYITSFDNSTGQTDWHIHRKLQSVIDVSKLANLLIYDANKFNTLINLDFFDPLQGKMMGVVRENLDIISSVDPVVYDSVGIEWGDQSIGKLWFDTSATKIIDYHQDDIEYNAKYWSTLFPNSDVAVYTWIESTETPSNYTGEGTPRSVTEYITRYSVNAYGLVIELYYYWVRGLNQILDVNKSLADNTIENYIRNPKNSGIAYFIPLSENIFGLTNISSYITSNNNLILHLGSKASGSNSMAHASYELIRENFDSDFLPGVPNSVSEDPESLYSKLLDSLSGADAIGATVPDPYLPRTVQIGIENRPRQSLMINRLNALKNYFEYVNSVLKQYPIVETRNSSFLDSAGEFFDTKQYWEYTNWWAAGYSDDTKISKQVSLYADLSALEVPVGTVASVVNSETGYTEIYELSSDSVWVRIGLFNGTIRFKQILWDYEFYKLGFGDNFFDTENYDAYPYVETKNIIRALNEQIFIDELFGFRNKSLILILNYIQNEITNKQFIMPWLTKTSLVDIEHEVRKLTTIPTYQSDNLDFLSGYIEEVKPYHVVIKDFLLKYSGSDTVEGDITDFDLPAQYKASIDRFISPQLVYDTPTNEYQYSTSDSIWSNYEYQQWYNNKGLSLNDIKYVKITTLSSYIALNSNSFTVDNAQGIPINGIMLIGDEYIGYANVDRATNTISGLIRGLNDSVVTPHIPEELIYMDLPPVVLLNGGRGYTEPPRVIAYIDTSIYPEPSRPAILKPIMSLDSISAIEIVDLGAGYVVAPKIMIDPSISVGFTSSTVNPTYNLIQIELPNLVTGDLVQYSIGNNTDPVGGLVVGNWYFVNVLSTSPQTIIALYDSERDAAIDRNRINLTNSGSGSQHYLSVSARAYAIATAQPVRENNITLRFDRLTYDTRIIDWISGSYYGGFFAGKYNNTDRTSSSSLSLQNTIPKIEDILASAQGIAFEITDVENTYDIEWSSLYRTLQETGVTTVIVENNYVSSTETTTDTLTLNDTSWLTVGDRVTFSGSLFGGVDNTSVYYVKTIPTSTTITLSLTSGGAVFNLTTATGFMQINKVELAYYVRLNVLEDGIGDTASGSTIGFYVGMPIRFNGAVYGTNIIDDQIYYVHSILSDLEFTLSSTPNGSMVELNNVVIPAAGVTCIVANNENIRTLININYPGMLPITTTTGGVNIIRCPLYPSGSGGTTDLYYTLPIFFTAARDGSSFGNIVEHDIYYVRSVLNKEEFTISRNQYGPEVVITQTIAASSYVVIYGLTSLFSLNERVYVDDMIINDVYVTEFGGIQTGRFYYISDIINENTLKLSETLNGPSITLTDETGSARLISQIDTLELKDDTGDMIMQVNLPVSPGQIDKHEFTMYSSSSDYPNLSGTLDNLLELDLIGSIGVTNILEVGTASITNVYNNLPLRLSDTIGGLSTGTTYYVGDYGHIEFSIDKITIGSVLNAKNYSTTITEVIADGDIFVASNTFGYRVNDPIKFTGTAIGGVNTSGTVYYIKEIISSTEFTISTTINGTAYNIASDDTGSMTMKFIATAFLNVGSPIIFRGTGIGLLQISKLYMINQILSDDTFNVTLAYNPTLGYGPIEDLLGPYTEITAASPLSVDGNDYIRVTATQNGSIIALSTTDDVSTATQYPVGTPTFSISFRLGGYFAYVIDGGEGYAVDNTILITGDNVGGTTPDNDLLIIVKEISDVGEITGVIKSGTPNGAEESYYMRVVSDTQLEVFIDDRYSVQLESNTTFKGYLSTNATAITGSTDIITVDSTDDYQVNDQVIFTGSVFGEIELGEPYYIKTIESSTELTVSSYPGGTTFDFTADATGSMLMTRPGDYVLLPEPFNYDQSIVKFNNKVYICIVSNNDTEFVLGKWELLKPEDIRMNALDRIAGYYQPTDDMPGIDITQLVYGSRYPNNIYKGNAFAPEEQYELDAIIIDLPFYPTNIALNGVIWDGNSYFSIGTSVDYTILVNSTDAEVWELGRFAEQILYPTDMIYNGEYYIITTNNNSTPLLRSSNGINWSTNGYYTPYSSDPYDSVPYDITALSVASISLNSVAYYNDILVAVGENIVTSTDSYVWTERFKFNYSYPTASTTLNGVAAGTNSVYTGYVAVGKGDTTIIDPDLGIGILLKVNKVVTSLDALTWGEIDGVTTSGFNAVTFGSDKLVAVGENGAIYVSYNGTIWEGLYEAKVIRTIEVNDSIVLRTNTVLQPGTRIRFTASFANIIEGTDYWILTTTTSTLTDETFITVSETSGGSTFNVLTSTLNTWTTLYVYGSPTTTLNDITYSDYTYIAVGDNGYITTSTDGLTWTASTSGTTESLNAITYNADDDTFIAVGDNNTIILSTNDGVSWFDKNLLSVDPSAYDVVGDEFMSGYSPEEMVSGVTTDHLSMKVITKPGSNWDVTEFAHMGYNVKSIELTPTSSTQTVYSFARVLQVPAQVRVSILDTSTGLSSTIHNDIDYTVNWVSKEVVLNTPLITTPTLQKLVIEIYEVGNGDQIVKSSTKQLPIFVDELKGWSELYLPCNYSAPAYQGGGIIRPGTDPITILATATDGIGNAISLESITGLSLNSAIVFQGETFGGIIEGETYYIKSISSVNNTITVSEVINLLSGTAGITFELTSDVGEMYVIVQVGSGLVWSDPLVYHNGNKLLLGSIEVVTRTSSSTNTITCNTTNDLAIGSTVVFSDNIFGGIEPRKIYYVKTIYDANEFTISETLGGSTLTLTDAVGGAEFISKDFAFKPADNGISAIMVLSGKEDIDNPGMVIPYNTDDDYIVLSLFNQTNPTQFGYTIPETQVIIADGTSTEYQLDNYLGGTNDENSYVEVNSVRLIHNTDYILDQLANSIIFLTSTPAANDIISVTTFNDTNNQFFNSQYNVTNPSTNSVTSIINISNFISLPSASTFTYPPYYDGTGYLVYVQSVADMTELETVVFKGDEPDTTWGNVILGKTYYVYDIDSLANTFKLLTDPADVGSLVTIGTPSTPVLVEVGGQPAVRITTNVAHDFSDNELVKIDGTLGSYELNNQVFYIRVISETKFDIYYSEYVPYVTYVNDPVTTISAYVSGGYAWNDGIFRIITTTSSGTNSSSTIGGNNYSSTISVNSTGLLTVDAPVYFSEDNKDIGDTTLGGLIVGQRYFVELILDSVTFTVTETKGGARVELANSSGTMYVTQWEQDNVDRVTVTVNGLRVPSSGLKINPNNNISIMKEILAGDVVTISSMIPSPTPNQMTYLIDVNKDAYQSVYRYSPDDVTWLTQDLSISDDIIYVHDVSDLVDIEHMEAITPVAVNGSHEFTLQVNKSLIKEVTVTNITTSTVIDSVNVSVALDETQQPTVYVQEGSWINVGDDVTIAIVLGGTIYINGEQIGFVRVNLANNTISGLYRGINSTGANPLISKYTEVYGIVESNKLSESYLNVIWNSYAFDISDGDPLQVSNTNAANFLNKGL